MVLSCQQGLARQQVCGARGCPPGSPCKGGHAAIALPKALNLGLSSSLALWCPSSGSPARLHSRCAPRQWAGPRCPCRLAGTRAQCPLWPHPEHPPGVVLINWTPQLRVSAVAWVLGQPISGQSWARGSTASALCRLLGSPGQASLQSPWCWLSRRHEGPRGAALAAGNASLRAAGCPGFLSTDLQLVSSAGSFWVCCSFSDLFLIVWFPSLQFL